MMTNKTKRNKCTCVMLYVNVTLMTWTSWRIRSDFTSLFSTTNLATQRCVNIYFSHICKKLLPPEFS